MGDTDKKRAGNGIHYFTCSEGRKWAHMPWGMITGDIPDGVIYPTGWRKIAFVDNISFHCNTYPTADEEPFAVIPADRIELVTEHVEATVMDALQALVDSGGKPVEGWSFNDCEGESFVELPIRGVDAEDKLIPFMAELNGCPNWYRYAYRPVTRVRIKPEVKPEPGYGYTLDGNPVPPPPEGWEIVPEGVEVSVTGMIFDDDGWSKYHGYGDSDHTARVYGCDGQVRACARRVVKESPTPETVEQGFSKYWQSGNEHRAIDAFRAGVAWAKEVQGE